ncbi:MAG: recombinase RecA [SAR202 cluster bacterium]|nr:recombinase RecA [Chloroflexota bacterium]MBO20436.1 recombinase RecA [Chloroflexota bacterium]MQF94448.1 recombinase RecA [SAR202 cluster bacterium]MQG33016.1 recombinase RecA [SAR202 cluster bacterium]HAA95502.1 recombinase RecA [Dehalococcoidia bacterium]|tara:strand:- start:1127 stop:2248 length:1122 start_codon:yes stop_codon:yes gene_type:complete
MPSTDKETKDKQAALEIALGRIEKDYGKGAVMRLGEIGRDLTSESIPTGSLAVDIALGIGGIPRGRVTEIFGAESAGKSTMAIHIMAETQRLGGIAAYIDVEHALDPVYAKNCGLDLDSLLIAQPDSAEQALDITEQLVRSGAVDAVVVDSVAALVPQAEIEGDMGDTHVGLQARLMSQALRKLTSTIHRSKTAVLFINQLREKIGVTYGSPEVTPGGRALKFYSSVRIDLRRVESIKQGSEVIGNRVRARIVKNKVAAPFRVAEFDIMFNLGISKMGDLLEIGVDQGIVKKSGAFYSYGDTKLGQGRENSKEFLIQHPEIAASVEGRIRGPNGTGNIEEGDPLSNGNAPHVENSVADILSGNTSLELEDDEE